MVAMEAKRPPLPPNLRRHPSAALLPTSRRTRFRPYKRGFWPARRTGAMRTRCTPKVRTAREPPDTERSVRRAPWNAAGQVPLHAHTRVLVRKAHRCDAYWMYVSTCGTQRTRFRNPLKAGSDAQGVQGRRVLEYSRSCATPHIRFRPYKRGFWPARRREAMRTRCT